MSSSEWPTERNPHSPNCRKHRKALIVEDETLVSWSLSNALEKIGFEIVRAESGEKAIEKLYSNRFDVVITDLHLPLIDGFEVAAAVKTFSPDVPVIMLSTFEKQDSVEKPSRANIDYYVEKPFDLREMTKLVERILASRDTAASRSSQNPS